MSLKSYERTVMFVDIVNSTHLKYTEDPEAIALLCKELLDITDDSTKGKWIIKSTGDGAMVVYDKDDIRSSRLAIEAAEKIIQQIDILNIHSNNPPIRIKIGISTGYNFDIPNRDIIGKTADLAARLCTEANVSGILLDGNTYIKSKLPKHLFKKNRRRLILKGIPLPLKSRNNSEKFYHFLCNRLVTNSTIEDSTKNILALYSNRKSLSTDLNPIRLLHLTKENTEFIIIGRTLVYWISFGKEMQYIAKTKEIVFKFLLLKDLHSISLDDAQKNEIEIDLPKAHKFFENLVACDPHHFKVYYSEQTILDSSSTLTIFLPGQNTINHPNGTRIVIKDINASPGENKNTLLLASPEQEKNHNNTIAHEIKKRMEMAFIEREIMTSNHTIHPLERKLIHHDDGLTEKGNKLTNYISLLPDYFLRIKNSNDTLPPLSIQIQITTKCSNKCIMCQHHKETREELSAQEWKKLFIELSKLGTKSIVISGGEPLLKDDFSDIIRFAHEVGFEIGLLTSGTAPGISKTEWSKKIQAIKDCISWVSLSIDGKRDIDAAIRKTKAKKRQKNINNFIYQIKDSKINIFSTITLQKCNIDSNIHSFLKFIASLDINRVNFKFATGSKRILSNPDFHINIESLERFNDFLWSDRLAIEKNNNLGYLRRNIFSGFYSIKDIANGEPIYSYYKENETRCFMPYLISLIDCNGDIYPCCHLFRDNHGAHSTTKKYRDRFIMGNIKDGFLSCWNNGKYNDLRHKLKKINVDEFDFYPCGECTRFCHHNAAITDLYNYYCDHEESFVDYISRFTSTGILWL